MRHRPTVPGRYPLLTALVAALAPLLLGFDYGTPILISSEAEIYELERDGEIDEGMRNQLLDMLWNPVELNSDGRDRLQQLPDVTFEMADEIIARREEQPFQRVGELRELVGRPVFVQCKAFVDVEAERPDKLPVSGQVSARMLEQFGDGTVPVAYLKGRLKIQKWLEFGVLVAEEEDVYGVEYADSGVTIEGERPKVSLERAHAAVWRDRFSVIAGHYKAGFGQRLTFDITDRDRSHGIYSDLKLYEDSTSYDSYSVSKRLLGIAGRYDIRLPKGREIELTLFGSINPQDLYYADIQPNDYTYLDGSDEQHYPTFPWVYREELIGLNTTFRFTSRSHVGVTAWGGRAVKRYDFDFTGYPIPNRPFYGALGIDTAIQIGLLDMYAEAAVTDSGGFAARGEWVLNPRTAEISMAMRYYGTNWDNPHSRGRSEPDELGRIDDEDEIVPGGKRDTDEVGPQLKAIVQPLPWLRLRAKGDLWYRPSLDLWNGYAEGRVDVDPLDWLGVDLLISAKDKDLAVGGREESYDGDADEAKGAKLYAATGLRVAPAEPLTFQVQYKHAWEDVGRDDGAFAHTNYVWGKVMWDIVDWMALTMRGKYYKGESDSSYGDHYGTLYAQLRFRIPGRVTLYARYELIHEILDEDETPDDDERNPWHKLKVAVDWRF